MTKTFNNFYFTSEYNSDDTTSIEGRTYTLNCNGVVGDMVYLTDLDYTANVGHNIVEVKIYGRGEKNVLNRPVNLTLSMIARRLRGCIVLSLTILCLARTPVRGLWK